MKLKYMGMLSLFLGVLLVISSYTILSTREYVTRNFHEDLVIDMNSSYSKCYYVYSGSLLNMTINSNGTIEFSIYSRDSSIVLEDRVIYSREAHRGLYNVSEEGVYCILFINNRLDRLIHVEYALDIYSWSIVEQYPLLSVSGFSIIVFSIIVLYYVFIRSYEVRGYTSVLEREDIVCKSKSLNKHECVIRLCREVSLNKFRDIVEYLKELKGYSRVRYLSENIVFLEKKGKLLTRRYEDKPRTLVISIKDNTITLNYIIPPLNASGSIDLKHIYEEVVEIKSLIDKDS